MTHIGESTLHRMEMILTLAGLAGVVLIFLSFAFDYTPARHAFRNDFLDPPWWSVITCIVLPVVISGAWLIRLIHGDLPASMGFAGSAISGICAVLFAYYIAGFVVESGLMFLFLFLVGLAAAPWLAVRGIEDNFALRGLAAMQATYAVQMMFWLCIVWGSFQTGAWLGVLTLAAYIGQIYLVADRRVWTLGLLIPLLMIAAIVNA